MNIENELKLLEQIIKEDNYETEDLENFVENSQKFVFLEKFLREENISFNQLENIAKIFVEYNFSNSVLKEEGEFLEMNLFKSVLGISGFCFLKYRKLGTKIFLKKFYLITEWIFLGDVKENFKALSDDVEEKDDFSKEVKQLLKINSKSAYDCRWLGTAFGISKYYYSIGTREKNSKNQEFKITDVYSEEKIENQLKKFIYKNRDEFENFFDTLSENRNEIIVIPASVVHHKIIELINKCSYFKRKTLLNIYFGRRQTFFNNLSRKMQKWNFGFEETREGGNLLLCKRNFFNTDYYAVNSNVIRLGVLDLQTTPLSVNSLGMDFDLKNKIVIKDKY